MFSCRHFIKNVLSREKYFNTTKARDNHNAVMTIDFRRKVRDSSTRKRSWRQTWYSHRKSSLTSNVFLYSRDYFTKLKKKLKMAAPKVTFYTAKLILPFSLLKVMTRFPFQKVFSHFYKLPPSSDARKMPEYSSLDAGNRRFYKLKCKRSIYFKTRYKHLFQLHPKRSTRFILGTLE